MKKQIEADSYANTVTDIKELSKRNYWKPKANLKANRARHKGELS